MSGRPPTPIGWSDTDWIKKLQGDEESPLACLHINQGSFDAAADAYEEEYKMSKRTALETADRLKEIYYGKTGNEAAAMLRQQYAKIGRLTAEREEHAAEIERLRAQVKRLRDALVGMVADDDVNGLRFTAAVLESMDCDDATVSLAAVRALIDIRPEGSAGEGKR